MTERENSSVVEVLRDRLGIRYRSSIKDGRKTIVKVISDEMNVSRDEADAITTELIDSGKIRYVLGTEEDREYDVAAQHDERSDAGLVEPDLTDSSDNLRANAIPGQGGPQTTAAGLHAGAVAPVAAGSGSAIPGALPLAAGLPVGEGADDQQRLGYWDFGSDAAGVVPSSTRKGQVEPRGT